ncbi:hypothetical protein DVH24_000607 [Malus domestica]|uniref:Uncharacterized protein n=1 Tax=Malus domestica TaxID=3750 RepID=A0A498J0D1_MALDO|nr:hypothetical protein DVH24_000607 [Malus domestica]
MQDKLSHLSSFFLSLIVTFLTISNLMFQLALFILAAGILCIYINYDCDRQRQEFRRTNGKCLVWGRAPSKVKFFPKDYMINYMHNLRLYWLTEKHDLHISDSRFIHYHIWGNKDKPSSNLRMVSISTEYFCTANTGSHIVRRFPTGSFPESTEESESCKHRPVRHVELALSTHSSFGDL